uniref:Uncharacterized protein n=1 Tax=Pseudo-nitzschia australis TaxID=44445 RepID=A0A7S4ASP3_9STRA|mmetsp:Transcript_19808/g.42974  ORF Transcript_19808/g.42974 Transcript_19808/m.42974 type:complete len:165 (-) Transcript_19808:420-914(-)
MIQRNDLATKALVKIMEDGGFEPTMAPGPLSCLGASTIPNDNATKRSSPLKRSRSSFSGSFDMRDVLKASEQVEETIAFPSVEWPSLDDADSDDDNSYNIQSSLTRSRDDRDDDEEFDDYFSTQTLRRKRQCRGLTRCNRSCNLSSLLELSAGSERRGSSGSLS